MMVMFLLICFSSDEQTIFKNFKKTKIAKLWNFLSLAGFLIENVSTWPNKTKIYKFHLSILLLWVYK